MGFTRKFYLIPLAILVLWCPLVEGGTTIPAWTITRLIVLVLFASIIYDFYQRRMLSFSYHPLYILLAMLGVTLIAQTIRAQYFYAGWQWFLNYASMFIVFIAMLKLDEKEKRFLVYILVACAIFQAIWGIVEYLAVLEPRPNGTFFNPNYFGGYLAGVSAWLLSEMISSYRRKKHKGFLLLEGMGLVLLIVGISVSGSRGALVALGSAFFFVGLAIWGVKVFPVVIVGALLFLLIPNPTLERLKHISEQDIYAWSRLDIWKGALAMIRDNPFGVGTGMYRFYSPRYAFPVDEAFARYGQVAESAHNAYLDIAVELGPLSVLIILVVSIFLIARTFNLVRREKNFPLAGAIGALASVMAHGAVDSIQKSPPSNYLAVICAGLLFSWVAKGETISLKLSSHFKYLSALFVILLAWLIIAPGVGYEFSERAKVLLRKGELDSAYRWQAIAVKVCPSNADLWYQSAQIEANLWAKNGNDSFFVKSFESLDRAQRLNPLNTNYYVAMADLVRRNEKIPFEKRVGAVVGLYEKAISIAPYNATFYVELAKALTDRGDYASAETAYRKALELEPRYASAMAFYGDLLMKMGRQGEARIYYQQALNIVENIASYKNRKESRYEQAMVRFNVEAVKHKLEENAR